VTVKQHDGKDDDDGKRIERGSVQVRHDCRLYSVPAGRLIRVTLRNWSAKPLSFVPVYVDKDGTEEPEEKIDLASSEVRGWP
jgi:hypothetical protein